MASGGTGDGDGGLTAHSTKARENRSIDTGKVFIIFFVSILIGFTSQQCLLLRLTAPAGECSPYGTNNQGGDFSTHPMTREDVTAQCQ